MSGALNLTRTPKRMEVNPAKYARIIEKKNAKMRNS